MRLRRKGLVGFRILAVAAFILAAAMIIPVKEGFLISTVRHNEPVLFIEANSRTITIGWRHSVELQPWMETYQVNGKGWLSLVETRFKAYGAGVPSVDGKVVANEDGYFVVRGIDREIPAYSLFYTPGSHYYLLIDSQKYPLADWIPPDTAVNISFQKATPAEWICDLARKEVNRFGGKS